MTLRSNDNNSKAGWLVLYSPFHKESEVRKLLEMHDITCFFPLHKETVCTNKIRYNKVIPAVPGIMFVKSDIINILQVIRNNTCLSLKMSRGDSSGLPFYVDACDVHKLMLVNEHDCGDVIYMEPGKDMLCHGHRVIVTDGRFKGMEGVLSKVKGLDGNRIIVCAGDVVAAVLPESVTEYAEIMK